MKKICLVVVVGILIILWNVDYGYVFIFWDFDE